MQPFFTVITVSYNAVATVGATVRSVLEQSFSDFELLLIDGASTDGTTRVVDDMAGGDERVRIVSEPDAGVYDAMNKGVRLARGKYLHFLNADDTYVSEHVLHHVANSIAADGKTAALYYGNLRYRARDGSLVTHFAPGPNIRSFLRRGCVTQQAIFYRRDAFEAVGYFDSRYRIVGDYEWLLRAVFRRRVRAVYVDVTIANFRMEGLSTHRETRREHHRERERLYLRFFPRKYVYRRYRDIKRSLNRALGSRPRRKPQRHDADPLEHSSPRIGLCPYPKRDNWHKYGNPHLHRIVEGLEKRGLGVIGVRADELRSPDACAKDKGLSAFYLHWATSCYDLDSYKHVGVPAGVDRVLRRIPGLRKMYRALQEPYTTAVDRVFGNAVARSGTRRIRAWCNDLHRCTVPVVWHQHDLRSHNLKGSTTFLSKLDHELHQRLYQACDAIVAHEQSSLDTVWQHYGARKRYVVAPLGPMIELPPVPRHEARRRLEVPSRATLFLYAGTSRQNRNPATAARAISRVRGSHGDVLLIIAGKNALNYLEAWDVDAVRVLEGFRTQDEMRDLFCAADFLVQDARDYLTSAVIRSALSYGLPVVARNEGSTKDMAAGALVEIGETGLEDAIERCLQLAPEELQSLRRQALARHKERTWQRSTNAIADLFFSMMDAESCSRSGAEVTE